jgi:cephalosporin hydroxylase
VSEFDFSDPAAVEAAVRRVAGRVPAGEAIPTFFDNYARWLARHADTYGPALTRSDMFRTLAAPLLIEAVRADLPRFQTWEERRALAARLTSQGLLSAEKLFRGSEVPDAVMAKSQGGAAAPTWRGQPSFKSVFDFGQIAILLWELRPKTIIELGSGTGGSALMLADLMRGYELETSILSIDLRAPAVEAEGVTFLEGDLADIARLLPHATLAGLPHPWLLIEDAHAHVPATLRHFDAAGEGGDYVIVEDSLDKADDITRFLREAEGEYRVDTYYTDLFGWNATSAVDSVFRRGGDG